jgi:hypothetical protein
MGGAYEAADALAGRLTLARGISVARAGAADRPEGQRSMPTVFTVLFTISTECPRSAAACWITSSKCEDGRGVAAAKEVGERARYQIVTLLFGRMIRLCK